MGQPVRVRFSLRAPISRKAADDAEVISGLSILAMTQLFRSFVRSSFALLSTQSFSLLAGFGIAQERSPVPAGNTSVELNKNIVTQQKRSA